MPRVGQFTLESWMMANGMKNKSFYSDKQDKDLTAIANYYGRKIITERLIMVTTKKKTPTATYITKVTLL